VKEITEKHKGIAMENIAKDGCGPTDMFRWLYRVIHVVWF
jgi:hypothetical protein